jgi:site-specific recombinase XerD
LLLDVPAEGDVIVEVHVEEPQDQAPQCRRHSLGCHLLDEGKDLSFVQEGLG